MKDERMELMCPDGRKGILMPKGKYEVMCEFIFETLEANERITLTELLETIEVNLSESFTGNLSFFALHVKLDLEARKLITICMERGRTQMIELKKTSRKKKSMAGLNSTIGTHISNCRK